MPAGRRTAQTGRAGVLAAGIDMYQPSAC